MNFFLDYGETVYTAKVLYDLREAIKKDLERFDLTPAVRRELNVKEQALTQVINTLIVERPARVSQKVEELGYPRFLIVAEWEDDALEVAETSNLESDLPPLIQEGAKTVCYKVVKATGQMKQVHISPEGAGEEYAEQRRKELVARKAYRTEETNYKPKYGNEAKYRVKRSLLDPK